MIAISALSITTGTVTMNMRKTPTGSSQYLPEIIS
jgi:hypothetical protein